MRHKKKTIKLGRSQSHRDSLLANQVISLIEHSRIKTTLAKARAVRPFAEKMVTIGRKNTLHARRLALSYLHHNQSAVKSLFEKVVPRTGNRQGGYTRIVKLGNRHSDASEMAYLEWVDQAPTEAAAETPAVAAQPETHAAPTEATHTTPHE
ncbi:MAG: 50S ribosomal protein L17 [Chthoniobacteraceae bacterium]|jgi:large subunit ribosomal protein L17|nr:50S ribosomal protein L17 [Chthoniobacteraceae bacterium]